MRSPTHEVLVWRRRVAWAQETTVFNVAWNGMGGLLIACADPGHVIFSRLAYVLLICFVLTWLTWLGWVYLAAALALIRLGRGQR